MTTPLSSPAKSVGQIHKVAMLFSGGPAPAANAVIASAAGAFSRAGITVLGIRNGYSRLMDYAPDRPVKEGVAFEVLDHAKMEGLRTSQGIMLGTSRANPGKDLKSVDQLKDAKAVAKLKVVYEALISLGVDALVSIGGDDTLTTAAKFKLFQDQLPADQKRIRVIHLPKTIDNDYEGIDFTFGYFTAVEVLATEVRNLLADARATNAYFLAQVMGRKAGWLAYGAAIAGEASLVIGLEDIPDEWWGKEVVLDPKTDEEVIAKDTGKPKLREIFDVEAVVNRCVQTMLARDAEGKPYGVIVMAEGLAEYLPQTDIREFVAAKEYQSLKPDEFGHFPVSQLKFSSWLGRRIAEAYQKETARRERERTGNASADGKSRKVNGVQFGYEIRCQLPTAFDVCLGSQLGVGAYRALAERGLDGVMVSVQGQLDLVYPTFEELIDYKKLRAYSRPIKPSQDFHQLARYVEVRVEE